MNRALVSAAVLLGVASFGLWIAAIWTDGDLAARLGNTALLVFLVAGGLTMTRVFRVLP